MIDEIHLQDVALIHDARLAPCAGLTVVTGESGSGKTALLSGIKLLWASAGRRHGARRCRARLTVGPRLLCVEGDQADAPRPPHEPPRARMAGSQAHGERRGPFACR